MENAYCLHAGICFIILVNAVFDHALNFRPAPIDAITSAALLDVLSAFRVSTPIDVFVKEDCG